MKFNEELNKYIELIGCSGKALSDASSISAPIISGYRNGTRIPKYQSKQLDNLIHGLSTLAKKNNFYNLTEEIIRENLEKHIQKDNIDFEVFRNNFNILIDTLKINISNLSRFIGYDASYLSKIRSGIRKPLNLNDFTNAICKYVIDNYLNINNDIIKDLIKCNNNDFQNAETIYQKIYTWLTNNKLTLSEQYDVNNFIKKLDDFDLNNYIKAINFDKLFTPTFPKIKTKSKIYYGLEGFKESQLEVLKQAAFFKSKDDIFWYSNMSMTEASKDLKFTKKYMMYLAFILKKGIKLNVVHDLNRPFKELMLGLEGWIPLYMTGQINPYYFKNNSNYLYSVIDCATGNAILHGECVTGNIEKSKLLVSTKKEDINYYQENSNLLLKKATPLMNIYTPKKKDSFIKILENNKNLKQTRKNILLNLPIYTISNDLLERILNHNQINESEKVKIYTLINNEKERINNILKNTKIIDEINILSKEEFINNKCSLDLSLFYYDKEITYNYDEYLEHIELLKEFKKNNPNYQYRLNNKNIFKNINIYIIQNNQVIISKINNPITNFVIYHPTLISAIQKFKAPIQE